MTGSIKSSLADSCVRLPDAAVTAKILLNSAAVRTSRTKWQALVNAILGPRAP